MKSAALSLFAALLMGATAAAQANTTCSFNGEAAQKAPTCSAGTVTFCNPKTKKAECITPKAKEKKQ